MSGIDVSNRRVVRLRNPLTAFAIVALRRVTSSAIALYNRTGNKKTPPYAVRRNGGAGTEKRPNLPPSGGATKIMR
jgi:hypothetical protein